MKRRGNKSNKVPNVKLRPAEVSASAKAKQRETENSWWAQDSQASVLGDVRRVDSCPRPFKGVVLCATGIDDKPALFKDALELGAMYLTDFTDKVTHLIAVGHGSAKYKCALARKIPILKPSWVTESHQIWLRGDDVDLEESVEAHRLPVFSDIVLSLSGIDDIARRTKINKLLAHEQGVYVKNIERPVKVTHLLCSGDEETDKMRYAEKFNKHGEAHIHLVWEEWFWDSLEFGGRFEESKYAVTRPRPERKVLLDGPSSPAHASSSAPVEPPPSSPPTNGDDDLEEEIVSAKRAPDVRLQIWGGLLKTRGFEVADGRLIRSPSKSKKANARPPHSESPPPSPPRADEGEGMLSSFRRVNSFAPAPEAPRRLFQRAPTVSAIQENVAGPSRAPSFAPAPEPSSSGLFSGLKFRALGEAKGPNVREAVEGCGGHMVSDEDADEIVDFIVVRLVSGSKFYREEGDEDERRKYRTECWLERCMFEERVCAPDEHVCFVPLDINAPIPDAERIHLSYSGLDQSEACWIRRLIRALGMTLSPNFSRRSTHLLCPSRTGAKHDKALEWGIPVIGMEWMSEIARTGTIPVTAVSEANSWDDMYADVTEQPIPDKGKGKARAVDSRIMNVTNSAPGALEQGGYTVESGPGALQSNAGSFGRPNGLLGIAKPDPLEARTPQPHRPHLAATTPSRLHGAATMPSSFSSNAGRGNGLTPGEIKRDMQTTRIPSSKSPSPMKMPPSLAPVSSSHHRSPDEQTSMKLATRALQESITSLLGKRAGEEDTGRAGKRSRKPPSRKTSNEKAVAAPPEPPYEHDHRMSPFDGEDEMNVIDGHDGDESMRVMYEDPGQRDEKERLMNLFGGAGEVRKSLRQDKSEKDGKGGGRRSDNGSGGLIRRSTRIAGF
ncbi:hypothetical protein PLICRDRAFT_179634 [Plicaturopsis crispa FD-325 SS-3]|uniref:BRCT domain-containing protein n=1 Tax=Plicaturopsis crispa FD-325 SS-3 TaxID=944288 RepID=A0A0C9SR58_PLICR|nr:hypothetical protein PLICRDRAFT_179634 [Plicaturopsis crispa FD-325 SS-3]